MKLKKILKVIFISIICIILMTVHCFAKTPNQLAKEYSEKYKDELSEINTLIDGKTDMYSQSLASLESYIKGEVCDPVPFAVNPDTAYPFYSCELNDVTSADDFSSYITRSPLCYWIIENEHGSQTFRKEKGKFIESGSGGGIEPYVDRKGNKIDITFSINGIADYVSKNFEDVDDYKLFTLSGVSDTLRLIYVKSDGAEYLIPFYRALDWVEFDAGKIYTVQEMLELVKPIAYDVPDDGENGFLLKNDTDNTSSGGGGTTEVKPKDEAPYIIASAAVSVSILLTAILIMIIKRKKQ